MSLLTWRNIFSGRKHTHVQPFVCDWGGITSLHYVAIKGHEARRKANQLEMPAEYYFLLSLWSHNLWKEPKNKHHAACKKLWPMLRDVPN